MPLSKEQFRNAQIIAQVGQQLGASSRDIQIALMTALVESNLINVNYGDRDSLGLFQQRPSQGWGTPEQVTDPQYASRKFFKTLFTLDRRESMSMGEAAQAVQRSAYPSRYAERQSQAASIMERLSKNGGGHFDLGDLGGGFVPSTYENPFGDTSEVTLDMPVPGEGIVADPLADITEVGDGRMVAQYNPSMGESRSPISNAESFGGWNNYMSGISMPSLESFGITAPDVEIPGGGGGFGGADLSGVDGWRRKVVKFARSMLGTPYVWGGTSMSGVDCSGLILLAMKRAGIDMPRISADQARSGKRVPLKNLEPGDLVAWDNSSRNNGADHIAIYIGGGKVIHAPRPGASVEVSTIFDKGLAWGVKMGG